MKTTVCDDLMALPEEKDSYSPEELRALLINDLNSIYGVKMYTYPIDGNTITIHDACHERNMK